MTASKMTGRTDRAILERAVDTIRNGDIYAIEDLIEEVRANPAEAGGSGAIAALLQRRSDFLPRLSRADRRRLSTSPLLRRVLIDLHRGSSQEGLAATTLAESVLLPKQTIQRALQALGSMGLVAQLTLPRSEIAYTMTQDGRELLRDLILSPEGNDACEMDEASMWDDQVQRALAQLVDSAPTPGLERELEGLFCAFPHALRTAIARTALPLQRPSDSDAWIPRIRRMNSIIRFVRGRATILTSEELRDEESRIQHSSEVWVVGLTPPNGTEFVDVVRRNIVARQINYFYVCTTERSASAVVEHLSLPDSDAHSRLTLIWGVPGPFLLASGRFFNLSSDSPAGWRSIDLHEEKEHVQFVSVTPSHLHGLFGQDLRRYAQATMELRREHLRKKDVRAPLLLPFHAIEDRSRTLRAPG